MPQPLDEDFANDLNKEERNEQFEEAPEFDDLELLTEQDY